MFPKILFLVLISAVWAYHLQVTPDELKEFYQEIDTIVRQIEGEAMGDVVGNMFLLDTKIEDAKQVLDQNLTEAAKPYWAAIKLLEEAAEAKGQNITDCVDSGTNKLYELNTTILYQAYQAFDYYNYSGNRLINSSRTQTYSVILELAVLGDVIFTCKEDTCATDVKTTISEYYERVLTTLEDAKAKVANYVTDYLPRLVVLYPFNSDLYVTNSNNILSDVTSCVNSTFLDDFMYDE